MDDFKFLTTLPISKFRQFRKAVTTLNRLGINYEAATLIVIQAMQQRESYRVPHDMPRSVYTK